ncbi:radical SAM protein [Candidatus Uhrbacteria bacterium]|nr:radical SAM protein [Candidatus Uhrbacteria bacterium]
MSSKQYRARPHRIYAGPGGESIIFNEETLELTEVDGIHLRLLDLFRDPVALETVLEVFGDDASAAREATEELVELDLLTETVLRRYLTLVDLKPKIRAFRVVLTEQCNLRCAECFVTKNQDRLRTMDPETLERVIRQSIPYGAVERLTYHFFGGEPLIRFDYIKRAVEIADEAVADGRMLPPLYTITTNLTLLDDEILSFFKERDVRVGVSVDGPEQLNNTLRMYVNGAGSYADVERNYRRLVDVGIAAHVLITPHPAYLEELPGIFRAVLARFPMQTVTINTPLHHQTLAWTVPGDVYARQLVEVMRIAQEHGISVDSAASPPLAALAHGIRREGPCALTADRIMASVSPDGRMSFCSQKWHEEIVLKQGPGDSKATIPVRRSDECVTCEARHICGGPCPAHQRIANAQIDTNKCDFMRTLLQEVAGNVDLFLGQEP